MRKLRKPTLERSIVRAGVQYNPGAPEPWMIIAYDKENRQVRFWTRRNHPRRLYDRIWDEIWHNHPSALKPDEES